MKTRLIIYLLYISLFVYAGNASAFTEGPWNNYFGTDAGGGTGGLENSFFGGHAGDINTGSSNTFIGYAAGRKNEIGRDNTFIGVDAGYNNISGEYNTFLGQLSGYNNTTGTDNVFIGHQAGFYETGSNKLFIDNWTTTAPLIYGEFDNRIAAINGKLGVGTMSPYKELTVSGTIGFTDGTTPLLINSETCCSAGSRMLWAHSPGFTEWGIYYDDSNDRMHFQVNEANRILTVDFNLKKVGVGTSNPSSPLTVVGVIESTSGGIKFPDGSTLTSVNTIDADKVDGQHASAFATTSHAHSGADVTSGTVADARIVSTIARDTEIMPTVLANDGSASTLDADLLDGQDSSTFMSAGTDNWVNTVGDTMTGDLTVMGLVDIDQDLYVVGNIYAESDVNSKKDIQPIDSSLKKILGIQGVSFAWKESEQRERTSTDGRHYGVIAQDVEQVLPEIVKEGKNNKKKVAYMELIPVLIEAMKEQQGTIKEQMQTITELNQRVSILEITLKGSLAMADD